MMLTPKKRLLAMAVLAVGAALSIACSPTWDLNRESSFTVVLDESTRVVEYDVRAQVLGSVAPPRVSFYVSLRPKFLSPDMVGNVTLRATFSPSQGAPSGDGVGEVVVPMLGGEYFWVTLDAGCAATPC